jgi:putative sugar O-methyltransferase
MSKNALNVSIESFFKNSIQDYKPNFKHIHWENLHNSFNFDSDIFSRLKFMRSNELTTGFDNSNTSDGKLITTKEIERVLKRIHSDIPSNLLSESNIGHPLRKMHADFMVSKSSLKSAYHLSSLIKLFGADRIKNIRNCVEIGGGFGGLAKILSTYCCNSTIYLYDLPETNVCSAYFLAKSFPEYQPIAKNDSFFLIDKNGFTRFAIRPAWRINELEIESVDLVINISSFMEMEIPIVNNYLAEAQRILVNNGLFYSANRDSKYKKSWEKNKPFILSDLDYGNNWNLSNIFTKYDNFQITEFGLYKSKTANVDLNKTLKQTYINKYSKRIDKKIIRFFKRYLTNVDVIKYPHF